MARSQFVALHRVKLTMEELLVTLIKRAQVACEESQRQRVAASNELLSKKDCVEMATQIDVYKYFYKKCVEILHSCVEI